MDQKQLLAEIAAKRRKGAVVARLARLRPPAETAAPEALRDFRALISEGLASTDTLSRRLAAPRPGLFADCFREFSESDWSREIATLLPHVAPSAEAACKILVRRPYQVGPVRKPFRAPNAKAMLADVRGRWLLDVTLHLGELDADIRWIAERGAYLAGWRGGLGLGWLLAGAIDVGDHSGAEVLEILKASATGEHPVGQMGHHVTQALLSCDEPRAWEFVEKLLVAAQRQEGLRQIILESVDEAHPRAFRRMLRLIVDEKLARFSSVVRAADVWFGFLWDGSSSVKVDSILTRVLQCLDDPSACAAALRDPDAETAYLALWSMAFDDVETAIPAAVELLSSESVEMRFVATHFLSQTRWPGALPPLVDMLVDADLRVATRALGAFALDATAMVDGRRLFERLEQLMARIPTRARKLEPIVWPWMKTSIERPHVATVMMLNAAAVSAEQLMPYVADLEPRARAMFVRGAAGLLPSARVPDARKHTMTDTERRLILELLGDSSADVRRAAFDAMATAPLRHDEIDRIVVLLERKPGDLRSAAIKRLSTLGDAELLTTADVLIADADELRRRAGLELLRSAYESERAAPDVRARIERYAADHATLDDVERGHIEAVRGGKIEVATTSDALGLVDRARLPRWPRPRARTVDIETTATVASMAGLAQLVMAHAETEIHTAGGEVRHLVSTPSWSNRLARREDLEAAEPKLPLASVWRAWLRERPESQRDADGCELLRAMVGMGTSKAWTSESVRRVSGLGEFHAGTQFLGRVIEWCAAWEPSARAVEFLLEGLENAIASIGDDEYAAGGMQWAPHVTDVSREKHRVFTAKLQTLSRWLNVLRWWREIFPASVQPAQSVRLYGLLRGAEITSRGTTQLVRLPDFIRAYDAGGVDEAELLDLLAGPTSRHPHSTMLRTVSTRRVPAELASRPRLLDAVDRCRRRIVEVEAARGDRDTAASHLVSQLRWTGGLDALAAATAALGKTHFARTWSWTGSHTSRQETLSHIVLHTLPGDGDTPEKFAAWARDARIGEARLVELALYAPQWAAHVSYVLQWPGLESAVWWIVAHTKDGRSWRIPEMKEVWAAAVSERTPLSANDLTEGAVDVAWFRSVYDELGSKRWTALDKAAKYAANNSGHTRAQLFSRALAGAITRDEILTRIEKSRHQDSVRALGLLPLAAGKPGQVDLLERYVRLEEFRREARKFGSQRQQSEKRAVAIALDNLARTAGYPDPQRLRWAMERKAVADLANGPIVVTRDDVSVTLSIDADGVPALAVSRSGKLLKALPDKLKKDAEVEALKDRLQELKRQSSRVRSAFEEAMCRGDRFQPSELRSLLEHPILAPAIARLVFVGDGTAGYLADGGRVLRDHAGTRHVLGKTEDVRIAHPHDLFARGDWSAWQRECFTAERIQPFKQVFRELYPLTDSERGTDRTRRYAGHQVNPRQALSLLGSRGWVARPDEGVSRTFHDEGITARLGFQEPFNTPAEVEGLTLEEAVFTRKGTGEIAPLDQVPARVFSEAMRDLDLVVSIAHRGGVDPEATASTVEMRAALVQETCALLGIDNVELQKHHGIVRGELATYSIHLGSGGVVVLPGTAIPVVAVHSQHRGRLFLPFADDDPRTAEVLSKVLLFARDRQIRDPNILQWIRAATGASVS